MATSESSFQSELLDDLKMAKAHAVKISDRFQHGIPDLYICYGGVSCWIELKFEIAPKRSETSIPVALIPTQRRFIRKEQRANGRAGWAVCVKYPTEWQLHAGTNPDQLFVGPSTLLQVRRRGEPWDVHALVQLIASLA